MAAKKQLPVKMIGGRKVRFSHHALDRLLDMAVEEWEIQAALVSPKHVRPHIKNAELTCYQKGRIVLITATDENDVMTVITVFWSNTKLWDADFAIADYTPESGRKRRTVEQKPFEPIQPLYLIEFTDGIYLRRVDTLPPKGFADIDVRCEHAIPNLIYKPDAGFRLQGSLVADRAFVCRGAAEGDAPTCGCWILIARGELVMNGEAFRKGTQVNMTVMNVEIGP